MDKHGDPPKGKPWDDSDAADAARLRAIAFGMMYGTAYPTSVAGGSIVQPCPITVRLADDQPCPPSAPLVPSCARSR